MSSLEKIIKLAKDEKGKFFIMDENGDPKLVVMSMAEYVALKNQPSFSTLAGRLKELSEQTDDLNKKIIEVQKDEIDDEDDDVDYKLDLAEISSELDNENIYIEPIEE